MPAVGFVLLRAICLSFVNGISLSFPKHANTQKVSCLGTNVSFAQRSLLPDLPRIAVFWIRFIDQALL